MSFGTVTHVGGHWKVTTEPHVKARLKRVFPRAPQQAADFILISDTPENTRDLQWFLERYPMDVEKPELMATLANEHVDMEGRLSSLMAAHTPPPNVELAVPARDYQKVAAHAATIRKGLLLADDVGLGKSVSAICCMMPSGRLPALVVCPTHMPHQWEEYLHRFAPMLRVHIVNKGTPYTLTASPGKHQADLWPDQLPDVIIINYHKLRGWAETLAGICRFVVFDEAQQLRNPQSEIYAACKHVAEKAELSVGLTATPIYNYGSEFFWVVDTILPGALGTRAEFIREWCVGYKDRIKEPELFGSYLRRSDILTMEPARHFRDDGIHIQPRKTAKTTGKRLLIEWTAELRLATQLALAARPKDIAPWLFCNRRGECHFDARTGNANGWDSKWQRTMAKALKGGLAARFTDRDIRKKVASDAPTLERAQALLGHADSRTTARHYRIGPERVKPTR